MKSVLLGLMLSVAGAAQAADSWPELTPLMGAWTGGGGGQPGQSGGEFSFAPDLDRHVVIRRAHSEYPATKGRPAFVHDDLMVVFREAGTLRAMYFDNEGHVIRYTATAPDSKLVFLSDPAPGPRFRLTYDWSKQGPLRITFEMAAPGTNAFKTYVEGTATRRK